VKKKKKKKSRRRKRNGRTPLEFSDYKQEINTKHWIDKPQGRPAYTLTLNPKS
jgi:hypothetical protein